MTPRSEIEMVIRGLIDEDVAEFARLMAQTIISNAGSTLADANRDAAMYASARIAAGQMIKEKPKDAARLLAGLAVIDIQRSIEFVTPDELKALDATALAWKEQAMRAQAINSSMDCRLAGRWAEMSGSHCPTERPCARCTAEREIERLTRERDEALAYCRGEDSIDLASLPKRECKAVDVTVKELHR